ncbi:hypothetical protein MKEN_01319400 [Mycena kentingensis (nom. inval.)]|nr:hypothetical protein MKEN_01319400 [Mycena kentingensis (nom. inval.)]
MVHVVTPPPTDVSRDDIIWLAGPRLVGILFNWGLLGVLSVQIYVYHINFPKDSRLLKFLVYIVYVLDWAQTCTATYDAFQWFVYGWGSIPALYNIYLTFVDMPIISSIVAAIVQATCTQVFFGWRIWKLSRSWLMFSTICVLALLALVSGFVEAYYLFLDSSEVNKSLPLTKVIGVRLGTSAAVDALIAIATTIYLLRSMGTGFSRTNSIITRLIRLTIETNTVTTIAATIDLICFVKFTNGLHQVSAINLCKLYSNTFLVLFNNRLALQSDGSVVTDRAMGLMDDTVRFSGPGSGSGGVVNVSVNTTSDFGGRRAKGGAFVAFRSPGGIHTDASGIEMDDVEVEKTGPRGF